ncbi:MAG TPA: 6-bladed beta-propeller, partial [Thiolapillus brandeum]|nr:6-bladed beta-propeller [Thiolapillus brandeum]
EYDLKDPRGQPYPLRGYGFNTASNHSMGGSFAFKEGGRMFKYSNSTWLTIGLWDGGFRPVRCEAGVHDENEYFEMQLDITLDPAKAIQGVCHRGNILRQGLLPGPAVAKLDSTAWEINLGSSISASPVVDDNRVFIGCQDGKFYAVDAGNGKILWSASMPAGIQTSAAVYDGKVYVCDTDGNVYCHIAKSGEVVWKARTNKPRNGGTAPGIACDYLFTSGTILKLADGMEIYRIGSSSNSGAAVYDGKAYDGVNGSVIDLKTTDEIASAGKHSAGMRGGHAVWPEFDTVYLDNYQGLRAVSARPSSGKDKAGKGKLETRWSHTLPKQPQNRGCAVSIGWARAYYPMADGTLLCLDAMRGNELWRCEIGENVDAPTTLADGICYVTTLKGSTVAVDAITGSVLWKHKGKSPIPGSAWISGGKVYVAAEDGTLTALKGSANPSPPDFTSGKLKPMNILIPENDNRIKLLRKAGASFKQHQSVDKLFAAEPTSVYVVDAGLKNLQGLLERKDELLKRCKSGEWIVLWNLEPAGLAVFNKLMGTNHILRPFRCEEVCKTDPSDSLVSKIHPLDLFMYNHGDFAMPARSTDAWTCVVDLKDIAPFCEIPSSKAMGQPEDATLDGDHHPLHLIDGMTEAWRRGLTMVIDEGHHTRWKMKLPRTEFLTGCAFYPGTGYNSITKIRLHFNDGEAPVELSLKPEANKQVFSFPPRKAGVIEIELAEWEQVAKRNIVSLRQVQLFAKRPYIKLKAVVPLLNIGVLVKYPIGRGGIILNQLAVPTKEQNPDNRDKRSRIMKALLGQLCMVPGQQEDSQGNLYLEVKQSQKFSRNPKGTKSVLIKKNQSKQTSNKAGKSVTESKDYIFDGTWPQTPEGIKRSGIFSAAVDSKDQIYILSRSQPDVQVYRQDGTFVRSWDIEDSSGGHHIKIDPDGNVWIADFGKHVVRKFSTAGKVLMTLGEFGVEGDDEKHFNRPSDMVILPDGDIFISDGYRNTRVIHFDSKGNYVKQWGTGGHKPGEFRLLHAIVADSKERLYIADRNNGRIQVFDTKGKLLAVWKKSISIIPYGLWMTKKDELWVCGPSSGKKDSAGKRTSIQTVLKLNPKGEILMRINLQSVKDPTETPGEVIHIHGIAADSKDNIYLGDIKNKRALKFSQKPGSKK